MKVEHLGQFIQHLAQKAKVALDHEGLKSLLAVTDLEKIKIPEDLFKAIDENLLSISAALDEHPQVKAKYTAEALNPVDKRMMELLEALDLDDPTKTEISSIRSSYKRQEVLNTKIQELIADAKKAAKATGKQDPEKEAALQKQIDDLQKELKLSKDTIGLKERELEEKLTAYKLDFGLQNALGGHKTIFDSLPSDIRTQTLKNLIDGYLKENDAELRFDEKGVAQPFKKDGSKLYGANHTLIDLPNMIETVLAKNKVLTVAAGQQQQNQQQQQQNQQQQQQNPGQHNNGGQGGQGSTEISGTNQTVMALNSQALSALEAL